MRAGLYVRISRDVAGEGLGVQRQEEDCRALAEQLGWEVAGLYVDNDVSATSGKPRPGYKRLLADIETKLVDSIIVWSPDRLYRRAADLETLIPVLEANSVQVRTVKAGDLDLSTAYGRMIARILGAIATGEGEVKSERWSRSWRQGREQGAPVANSRRLFGYERDGQTVIPREAEAARHIAQMLLDGSAQYPVCRWLTANDFTTSGGNIWRPSGLKRFLINPRIAGYSTHKGEIVAEGTWEPLLERETWEEVRALLTSRTRPYVPRKSLLNGLIFCGKCGMRMITSGSNGKRYYRCPQRPGMEGCGGTLGVAEPIEQVVETFAEVKLRDPRVLERIEALRASPVGAQAELANLEMRVQELEHSLDEPGTPVATILRAIDRTKERQAELIDKLASLPRVAVPEGGRAWPEDLERRRALVDLVVQRIDLAPRDKPTNRFQPERVKITER